MTAHRSRLKKRYAGSELSQSRHKEFVLYLDENLCNTQAILAALNKLGVRFERHLSNFHRGVSDEEWLPMVGKKGWVLLTADKRIRYNFLEKRALKQNAVCEFVFASGNLSGLDMAHALEAAIDKMRRLHARNDPPFVAAITKKGEVHLRWPK